MRDSYAMAITFTDAHIRNNYVLTFITVGEEETSVISRACFYVRMCFCTYLYCIVSKLLIIIT